MHPQPIPDDLLPWAKSQLKLSSAEGSLEPVAGDASNRRYFRLRSADRSLIVMQAPPATEKNAEFIAVQALLAKGGICVPQILAHDIERGYLLLGDLGRQMLLPLLNDATVDAWYSKAGEVLLQIAQIAAATVVPNYDRALLNEELSRLPEWFLVQLLGLELSPADRGLLAQVNTLLVSSAQAQPQVLVHRDFHSRNLMPQPDGQLGVIDFQDAVIGPITYDLVSLLRDCYIRWPKAQVRGWALGQRDRLVASGLLDAMGDEEFLRYFDLMGLQRHLKVLGTFARLYLRDGKAAYLQDLPLVLHYVEEQLSAYAAEEPVLAEFNDWWRERVIPAVARQPWSVAL
ncbi:phosphotransferase [Parahaliea sp. F7430]|uniref:Phosphotransferase n=1 Tax=Sediminihaliea albiluteola TaxID=2758564 RepID=A0A7W2TY55_9GAMM|nr:phosphotransferase [Sediminihaliea albiluteola]MBA6414075.1 phosphotransferase [Sediminihaliea albiluteola]